MADRMGLLGKKIGMTQKFDDKGVWVPMCVVQTGPCVVLDVKSPDREGYSAVMLGFDERKENRTPKPERGVFSRAKTTPKRFVREIRVDQATAAKLSLGQTLSAGQVFRPGDIVDVTGTSKGKGFQGVVKRYHFAGFKATHGTHEYFRHGGSIGCRLTPGRVVKGTEMPGQMGNRRVTVQNLRVIEVLDDKNLLLLSGAVPGAPESYVQIRQAAKHPARGLTLETQAPPAPAAPEADAAGAAEQA